MKVASITKYEYTKNHQSFGANKFRLPIDVVTKSEGFPWFSAIKLPGKWIREYDNPEAEVIYQKAQKAKTFNEKIDLYSQMGSYKLKKLTLKERLIGLYDEIRSKFL